MAIKDIPAFADAASLSGTDYTAITQGSNVPVKTTLTLEKAFFLNNSPLTGVPTLPIYTIATLPAAASWQGGIVWCSDLGGGQGPLGSNGVSWRRIGVRGYETKTNTSASLAVLTNAEDIEFNGALTANRTQTLTTTNAYTGARFRIKRSATGAFTMDIVNGGGGGGTLYTFASSTTGVMEAVFGGTNWVLWA